MGTDWATVICFNNEKTGPLSRWWRSFISVCSTKPWQRLHASTLDFFFDVRGLADSAGSGEPGGSVGGLGAFSTSPSGSRGREEPSETPENKRTHSHPGWLPWFKLLAGVRSLWRSQNRWQPRMSSFTPSSQRRRVYRDVLYCCKFHSSWKYQSPWLGIIPVCADWKNKVDLHVIIICGGWENFSNMKSSFWSKTFL